MLVFWGGEYLNFILQTFSKVIYSNHPILNFQVFILVPAAFCFIKILFLVPGYNVIVFFLMDWLDSAKPHSSKSYLESESWHSESWIGDIIKGIQLPLCKSPCSPPVFMGYLQLHFHLVSSRDLFYCHLQKSKTTDFAEAGEEISLAAKIGERNLRIA